MAPLVTLMFGSHNLDEIAKAVDKSVAFSQNRSQVPVHLKLPDQINALSSQRTAEMDLKREFSAFQLEMGRKYSDLREEVDRKIDSKFENIQSQLNLISSQLANLSTDKYRRSSLYWQSSPYRHRSSSRSRDRQRNNSDDNNSSGVCYYHRRFAENARKCILPCNYRSDREQGN